MTPAAVWDDKQWKAVESLLEEGWKWKAPGFTRAKGNAYRVLLAGIAPARVVMALQVLIQRGETWGPSAAEIVAAANADVGRPTFDEVFARLFERVNGLRAILGAPDDQVLQLADDLHPYVGAFVRSQTPARLRAIKIWDPEFGDLRRKELREAWERLTEACDERVRTGRALDAAGRGRQLAPGRLDPLGLLGLDRDQRPELTTGERHLRALPEEAAS